MEKLLKNPGKIRKAVKNQYARMVSNSGRKNCCSCSPSKESMKGNLVKSAGYDREDLKAIPDHAVENSFGCGNPLAYAEVKEGQTVLDIGSGAGIDCFLAAQKVGTNGKVIGIDMTERMIQKARTNAQAGGYSQVEFRLGEAESMPVEDASVDWVISNCVINLSPDKEKVFQEIARVLKPGGRFSISDIMLGDNLPEVIADNVRAWTGCVAGAIKEHDYIQGLRTAGLSDVIVESRFTYDVSTLESFFNEMLSEQVLSLIKSVEGQIWSAKIKGQKLS